MSVQFLSSRSGASSLQADPSPILGGDLSANGHAITGVSQLAIGVGSDIADLFPFSVYQPDDNDVWYAFQGGLTQPVRRYLAWFDYDAVDANSKKWLMGVGNSNSFVLFNAGNAVHPFYVYDDAVGSVGGVTVVNSSQAQAVRINYFGVGVTALGSGGLEVYSGGLTPKLWGRLANNELQIHDQSVMAAGVGGELELWGRIYDDPATVLFPSCRLKAKKESATNADSKTRLAFSTTTSGGSPTEKVWIDSNGRVAIAAAEFNPSRFLHIQGTDYTAHARVENIAASSWTSFRTELPGWEIVCGNMTTGWLAGGLKFYSTDPSFTTTNPKLLGGLDGRVTQAYDADTKGGFAVDLVVTDNTPGTAAAPKPIFAAEGSAGTAVGDRPRCIRLFDPDDGAANYYTGGWRLGYRTAEATLSGASTTIQVNVPAGAKLVGTLLRVDTAITSGDGATSWAAAYTGGASATIGTGLAFAKNTKANALFNPYAATPIASSEVDVTITPNTGTFTGGVVHAQVFFEYLENLGDAP